MDEVDGRTLRARWLESAVHYSSDRLEIKGFQVMQRWEEDYMAALAGIATRNGGRVLEVGFGMGISASYIQRHEGVTSHVVIECHPDVVQHAARTLFPEQLAAGRMVLINAFWQDAVPLLQEASFDGILFDSIELDREPHLFNSFPFFRAAHRLLREGGIFTYFSDEATQLSQRHLDELRAAGFTRIDCEVCQVHPPADCRYWHDDTIAAPIVTR